MIDPPLCLMDPFQKASNPSALNESALFILAWYLSQGLRFETIPLITALVLLVAFAFFIYELRKRVRCRGCRENPFIHSHFEVSEAWLNAYVITCTILVFLLDYYYAQKGGDKSTLRVLSPDPVLAFTSLFVGAYCVTNQISGGSHSQFYNWFSKSQLDIATRRGWGARGYDLFGIFPQAWIPRLSTSQFLWLSIFQTWNFCAAWYSPQALRFLLAFFLVLLRHSMLFAENNAGMHKPVLVPAVCWYLAFSPQLWSATNFNPVGIGPLWPTSFVKLHIVSTYFASGLGKVIVTWKQGKWNWADGTNMQYYLFAAGFARPGRNGSALPRIGWFIERPWACVILGIGGLAFELGSPLALLSGRWCILLFSIAIQFHYGIYYLQGIDFTGQWVPCLLVFLVDRDPVNLIPSSGINSTTWELVCWVFSAFFLLGQLYCAFTLREVTAKNRDKGGLPFSCMHMFTLNSNIFGDDFISWFTLMSGDQRASGHLGIMEWSGPIFTDFQMSEEDMKKIPFKVVWFGHTMCKHKFLQGMIKPEYQNKHFLVFANFELSPKLKRVLQQVCRLIEPTSDASHIRHRDRLEELVELQRRAVHAFNEDVVESPKKTLLMRGDSFLSDNLDKQGPEEVFKNAKLVSQDDIFENTKTLLEKTIAKRKKK